MTRQRTIPTLAALATLWTIGCSETVGFLSVNLSLPQRSPPLLADCKKDPRRANHLTLSAACTDGTVEESFAASAGTAVLNGVPLGDCTVSVVVKNAFGSTVLSGSADVSVVTGENPPLSISLTEATCNDSSCDADGDGISDVDEKGLGTDPAKADSDGDGLKDGFEVSECCSDPLKLAGDKGCRLAVQGVEPPYGVVGDAVMVLASTELNNASAKLGGKPMEKPVSYGKVLFGKIGKNAILGPVALTSEGTTAPPSKEWFATLVAAPETVSQINLKSLGLITRMEDIASRGTRLYILGFTPPNRSTVIVSERVTGNYQRTTSEQGIPLAVAAGKDQVLVLLGGSSSSAKVVAYQPGQVIKLTRKGETWVGGTKPIDLVLEPSGKGALLLFATGLARLSINGTSFSGTTRVEFARPSNTRLPPPFKLQGYCTGLGVWEPPGVAAGGGEVFLSCNFKHLSCIGKPSCTEVAHILQLSRVQSCLDQLNRGGTAQPCWKLFAAPKFVQALGSPVVDPSAKRVYLSTTGGLLFAPLSPGGSAKLQTMSTLLTFTPAARTVLGQAMVMMEDGTLLAADGNRVARMQPRAKTAAERQGVLFRVGPLGEPLARPVLSEDGSRLDILQGGKDLSQALVSVCLKRCKTCLCRPSP